MKLKSNSGILDNFNDELNPIIWDGFEMKSKFKENVLERVNSICKDNDLSLLGVLIYGGNAGYQYGPNSDADISVYIDWNKANNEKYEELASKFRDLKFVYDGIEVHFMLKSPDETEQVEANENVYDIVNSTWLQEPVKLNFNPVEELAKEIDKANIFKRVLTEKFEEVQRDLKEMKEAGVTEIPLNNYPDLQKLVDVVSQIRKNRDIEHKLLREKAIRGEKITFFDRATENEIVWKMIADLPMTNFLKQLSYK